MKTDGKKIAFAVCTGLAAVLLAYFLIPWMVKHRRAELAEERLEDKYGIEFDILSVGRNAGGYFECYACPAGIENCAFGATIDLHDERFGDRYVQRVVANKAAAVAKDLTGADYIHTTDTLLYLDYDDPAMSIEEYVAADPEFTAFSMKMYFLNGYDADKIRAAVKQMGFPVRHISCAVVTEEQLEHIMDFYSSSDNGNDFDFKLWQMREIDEEEVWSVTTGKTGGLT